MTLFSSHLKHNRQFRHTSFFIHLLNFKPQIMSDTEQILQIPVVAGPYVLFNGSFILDFIKHDPAKGTR